MELQNPVRKPSLREVAQDDPLMFKLVRISKYALGVRIIIGSLAHGANEVG